MILQARLIDLFFKVTITSLSNQAPDSTLSICILEHFSLCPGILRMTARLSAAINVHMNVVTNKPLSVNLFLSLLLKTCPQKESIWPFLADL